MVLLTGTSSFLAAHCEIGLLKRKTSSVSTSNDLMNTAFYEPDFDVDVEIVKNIKNRTVDEKPDNWEDRLDELYPFVMFYMLPLFIQFLLILLITSVVYITGIAAFSDKCAAYLYYFLSCYIF